MMVDGVCKFRGVGAMMGLVAAAGLATPATARADAVTVPNATLLPNTANQSIPIYVTGATAVSGVDFYVQIGDGGATNSGVNTGPVLSNVDILTGTILGGNNTGVNPDSHPLIWSVSTTTNTGFVADSGLLATLTVSTVGMNSGTFPLLISGVGDKIVTGGFTTDLVEPTGALVPLTITNGSITISTPEPATIVLASGALFVPGVLRRGRRRRV